MVILSQPTYQSSNAKAANTHLLTKFYLFRPITRTNKYPSTETQPRILTSHQHNYQVFSSIVHQAWTIVGYLALNKSMMKLPCDNSYLYLTIAYISTIFILFVFTFGLKLLDKGIALNRLIFTSFRVGESLMLDLTHVIMCYLLSTS